MIPDPNLVNVKRVLDLAAILSWVLLGVSVLGLFAYIVFSGLYGTAFAALVVRLTVGVHDAIAQSVVFGFVVIVSAPLTGFLFDSGRKLSLVEKKYGLDGATQLYEPQRAPGPQR